MKRVYRCRTGTKDRIYVIEDRQRTLFDEPYSFTIHFGRKNKWLNRKHIHCDSLADKEKKIERIEKKRRRHGYSKDE